MRFAKRLDRFPPYVFAALDERLRTLQAEGVDIIRLDIGSPDLPPAEFIVDTLAAAVRQPDRHGYPGYGGLPALRRAIADYYHARFQVDLNPEREVLPLIGSKEGIVHLALACVGEGDVVLVPDPGYPAYQMGALIAGGQPYSMPLTEENNYLPDLKAIPLEVARDARLMWLNYPHNPTGAVAGLAFFAEAVAFARRHDILLCHDAPYVDVAFDGYQAPSILQVPGAAEVALEFNSLSKSYNMAGWRVGMAVGNAAAVSALLKIKSNIDSGIFLPIQAAAIAALNGDQDWIAARNRVYQARRDIVLAGLAAAGLQAGTPRAGLYVWLRVPPPYSAADFATRLLETTGVSTTPGSAFGAYGEGYLRISLGQDTARIQEAMRRLAAFSF